MRMTNAMSASSAQGSRGCISVILSVRSTTKSGWLGTVKPRGSSTLDASSAEEGQRIIIGIGIAFGTTEVLLPDGEFLLFQFHPPLPK